VSVKNAKDLIKKEWDQIKAEDKLGHGVLYLLTNIQRDDLIRKAKYRYDWLLNYEEIKSNYKDAPFYSKGKYQVDEKGVLTVVYSTTGPRDKKTTLEVGYSEFYGPAME